MQQMEIVVNLSIYILTIVFLRVPSYYKIKS